MKALLKTLEYRKEEGRFYWKNPPQPNTKRLMGKPAGTVDRNGYVILTYRKRGYKAHRLIFEIEHGRKPKGVIDHINGNRVDNRIENLRETSYRGNCSNTYRHRAGKLVGTSERNGKWRSTIRVNGKHYELGLYETEMEAHLAYKKAYRAHRCK